MIAEEIMIGNWLLYEGLPVQVEAIDALRKYEDNNVSISIKQIVAGVYISYIGRWLNHFEPIVLTEHL